MTVRHSPIRVAADFSRYPAGRFRTDGPYSGERFRDEYLIPTLERAESVVVDLDGARGYGSSFLEEAFGGLIRKGYRPEQVNALFELRSEKDPSLIQEIKGYIEHGDEE